MAYNRHKNRSMNTLVKTKEIAWERVLQDAIIAEAICGEASTAKCNVAFLTDSKHLTGWPTKVTVSIEKSERLSQYEF